MSPSRLRVPAFRVRQLCAAVNNLTASLSRSRIWIVKIEKEFQFIAHPASYNSAALAEALVHAGHSNTRARRAVLAAITEIDGQATPAELLAHGRLYHPGLGLVTVYRTLDILLALGLVRKLHSDDGCHTYAPAMHDHGHHVICRSCQHAVEVVGCDIGGVITAVEAQTGFRVQSHWLEVFGVCPECQDAWDKAQAAQCR